VSAPEGTFASDDDSRLTQISLASIARRPHQPTFFGVCWCEILRVITAFERRATPPKQSILGMFAGWNLQ
jgi:hypothetical protein